MSNSCDKVPDYVARENSYTLLAIIQSHAPTGADKMKCADVYNKARADGAIPHVLEQTMASTLIDGLNSGNWPWTSYTV